VPVAAAPTDLRALRRHYHRRLLAEVDLRRLTSGPPDALAAALGAAVADMAAGERRVLSPADRSALVGAVVDEVLGLGPLQPLLDDPSVTEVIANGPREVWVERDGRLARAEARFDSPEHLRHVIDRVVAPLGRRVDDASPMVDARLPDGSRVNAVLPPLALDGPLLTIRRFPARPLDAADLLRHGAWDEATAAWLATAVAKRRSIVVSGGTGSGKTTVLGVLAGWCHPTERILTIEDAAELRVALPHVVRLEARPANVEGRGEITMRALVRNALRMRPDRIIVGEVRGPEAVDMLAAMHTGHDGSMTTVHANSPADALRRIETMALMAGLGLPLEAVREQVHAAVDVVVQLVRRPDGSRRVREIVEVVRCPGRDVVIRPVEVAAPSGEIDGAA
jgi:pilus assembly protein CpaF